MKPLLRLGFLVLLLALGACQQGKPGFRATDITGAEFARNFTLADHTGKRRSLGDFRGRVVVMFFGFTHCPDVCPTTLAELATAVKTLGADADKVQVLLVTVDPERDTPQALSQYVTAFDPRFLALRGTVEETAQVAKDFRIIYQKVVGVRPETYTMDHSAGTYIFDQQGRVRLYVSYGQGSEVFAHDIALLLKEPQAAG
jgi:protein SCO1/2